MRRRTGIASDDATDSSLHIPLSKFDCSTNLLKCEPKDGAQTFFPVVNNEASSLAVSKDTINVHFEAEERQSQSQIAIPWSAISCVDVSIIKNADELSSARLPANALALKIAFEAAAHTSTIQSTDSLNPRKIISSALYCITAAAKDVSASKFLEYWHQECLLAAAQKRQLTADNSINPWWYTITFMRILGYRILPAYSRRLRLLFTKLMRWMDIILVISGFFSAVVALHSISPQFKEALDIVFQYVYDTLAAPVFEALQAISEASFVLIAVATPLFTPAKRIFSLCTAVFSLAWRMSAAVGSRTSRLLGGTCRRLVHVGEKVLPLFQYLFARCFKQKSLDSSVHPLKQAWKVISTFFRTAWNAINRGKVGVKQIQREMSSSPPVDTAALKHIITRADTQQQRQATLVEASPKPRHRSTSAAAKRKQ